MVLSWRAISFSWLSLTVLFDTDFSLFSLLTSFTYSSTLVNRLLKATMDNSVSVSTFNLLSFLTLVSLFYYFLSYCLKILFPSRVSRSALVQATHFLRFSWSPAVKLKGVFSSATISVLLMLELCSSFDSDRLKLFLTSIDWLTSFLGPVLMKRLCCLWKYLSF